MKQMQVMCKTITGVEYLPHISESDTRNSVNKERTQVSRNRLAKSDTAYLGMKVDAGFFSLRQKYQHINYTAYFNFFSKKKKCGTGLNFSSFMLHGNIFCIVIYNWKIRWGCLQCQF